MGSLTLGGAPSSMMSLGWERFLPLCLPEADAPRPGSRGPAAGERRWEGPGTVELILFFDLYSGRDEDTSSSSDALYRGRTDMLRLGFERPRK